MSGDNAVAPVIIKRKKVSGGHGHHGGSWKVAYADFVTAMMAFFMMMWLLNATTETQRSGLADYFSPTIAISPASGGGDGMFGGDSVMATESLHDNGAGATAEQPTQSDRAQGAAIPEDVAESGGEEDDLRAIEEMLNNRGGESLVEDPIRQHVVTRVTDEGLVVEVFETAPDQFFTPEGVPTPLFETVMAEVADAATLVTNPVAIAAHTAAFPIVQDGNPAWDASRQRAVAAQTVMTELGLAEERVTRVTAYADRNPATDNPMAARNNRIEVVFLRR